MPTYLTPNRHGYSVRFSRFNADRLAVATSQFFGLAGGGTLFILELTPDGGIQEVQSFQWSDGLFDVAFLHRSHLHLLVHHGHNLFLSDDHFLGELDSHDFILFATIAVCGSQLTEDLSATEVVTINHYNSVDGVAIVSMVNEVSPSQINQPNSPCSVTLQAGEDDQGKPLGVEYSIRTYVGENEDDKGHKRSQVGLVVKKLQYAPPTRGRRLPSSLVSKGFTFSQGKINLEVTLDREIYYHGEKIAANVVITNNSRKAVKNIKVFVVQHCEVTMVNAQFSKHVASLETREGCPITPGASFTKTFYLVPLASSNKDRRGIALDGHLKDDDVNLASSTLISEGKSPSDAMGIVISYSVRVKLSAGTLGGELVTDVPFKLLNPAP
uniref:Arrestin C-terminal-like domain-containing protein n=1 Tax=Phlebotomus papatasi TaxID=29031 RepID=A0A1B0DMI6_PHLPP